VSGERDLDRLLEAMDPVVRPGAFVFVTVPADGDAAPGLPSLASVHEAEGVTHVLRRPDADARMLPYDFVAAWITLEVHSALDAVGLTAAVATALAGAGISCNVLAGYHHDHLLVPHDRAVDAVEVLRSLGAGDRP
jgi:uncharacterized protein